jgi:hypothetical protein
MFRGYRSDLGPPEQGVDVVANQQARRLMRNEAAHVAAIATWADRLAMRQTAWRTGQRLARGTNRICNVIARRMGDAVGIGGTCTAGGGADDDRRQVVLDLFDRSVDEVYRCAAVGDVVGSGRRRDPRSGRRVVDHTVRAPDHDGAGADVSTAEHDRHDSDPDDSTTAVDDSAGRDMRQGRHERLDRSARAELAG